MKCRSFASVDSSAIEPSRVEKITCFEFVTDGTNQVLKPLPHPSESLKNCRCADYDLTTLHNLGLDGNLKNLGSVDMDPLFLSDFVENVNVNNE